MSDRSQTGQDAKPKKRGRLSRWLIRLFFALLGISVLGGGMVGVAEYHTSQPEFCASCHNMVPYYKSWQADLHGGKLEVACVECHYAPGEKTTIKAKLRGLSQVASYFGGRSSGTRPRARVNEASCMTSKCHGDLKFMDKPIQMGTVRFVHAKHLKRTDVDENGKKLRLEELQKTLKGLVGEAHFVELEKTAKLAEPAGERQARLAELCRDWNATVEPNVLVEFSQLNHRGVRIAQLHDLQCTNCHMYHDDSDGHAGKPTHHFQVHTTTCFTCHFNNEGFNTGTNTCLMCHEPPQKEIMVHEQVSETASKELKVPELRDKTIKMNHAEIVARKVNCISCHADVAREDSTVSRRDCEHCHDQPEYLADFKEPLSLDVVVRYHKAHVEQQRANCLDCHSEIHHRLVGDNNHPAGFLSASLENCTNCHPHHHAEQVVLLMGSGGHGVEKSSPNPMFGARTNCYGCHVEQTSDLKKGEVVRATQQTCVACHGERYGEMFEKWKAGVEISVEDAEKAYQDAVKLLAGKADASVEARQKADALLKLAEADLQLVKRGNGIHNVTYAIELLDSVTAHCQQATEALNAK